MIKLFLKYILAALVFSTIFIRCASIAPPQGGPRDSIAPRIISINPPQYSVNFKDKRINIEFDEYVLIKDQSKEVITSPNMDKKPTLTPKGRSIQVDLQDTLLPNTTYAIDFGNAIVDNNESNKLGYFSYVFSTGNYIDSLIICGLVVDAQKRDSLFSALVFFFDAKDDSIPAYDSTLFNARAEAIFRTDSSGLFFANILKDKEYRVYAVMDKNGNHKYESGTDMVGILPGTFNPTKMPDFDMWIEPGTKKRAPRRNIDKPQLHFESFMEIPKRRQMLTKSERPERQKILFTFNTIGAKVNSLKINGMDSTWLVPEYGIKGDSVWYWITPPDTLAIASLADTLKGEITYLRDDSLWQKYPYTEKFSVVHRVFQPTGRTLTQEQDSIKRAKLYAKRKRKFDKQLTKQLRRARKISLRRGDPPRPDSLLLLDSTLFLQVGAAEKARQDSIETAKIEAKLNRGKEKIVNPFLMNTVADNPLNPEKNIVFKFGMPLAKIDSARIELIHLQRPKVETAADGSRNQDIKIPIPFTLEVDSASYNQHVTLKANWKGDNDYQLTIPSGVFTNIAFQSNDTLTSKFAVAMPDKFGTILLEIASDSTLEAQDISYILEITSVDDKVIERIKGVRPGQKHKLLYIRPGKVRIKVTEDLNNNGTWDTGSLVERRQAERIRQWFDPNGEKNILIKENWEVPLKINLKELIDQP